MLQRVAAICVGALVVATAASAPASAALDDRLVAMSSSGYAYYMSPMYQTVEADGSDSRHIDGGPQEGSHRLMALERPVWSPDGRAFAALVQEQDQDAAGNLTVRHVSVRWYAQDGSEVRVLATDAAGHSIRGGLTFTNDGSHLAYFTGLPNHDTRIGLVRVDGSARTVIDPGRGDMDNLQWSPDGSLVTFTSGTPDGATGIFAINPDGTGLRLLARESSSKDATPLPLSWSPDGDRFVYARNAPDSHYDIVVVNRDGTVERTLATTVARFPRWSPDGRWIAISHQAGELTLLDPDGGAPRTVSVPEDVAAPNSWSPDSRHLVMARLAGGWPHPVVVDIDTGETTEVPDDTAGARGEFVASFAPLPTTPPATRNIAAACPEDQVPDAGFSDTAGSTFVREIDCVAWYDVARGTTATTYSPERTVSRVQMARFLTRVAERAGVELDTSDAGFEDLDHLDQGARDAVNAVANLGVAQGASPTRFAPSQPVSRGQMASFLARLHAAMGDDELGPRLHCFSDVSTSVHRAAAERLCGAGVAAGVARGVYAPGVAVTRAQMAGFLARLLDLNVESGRIARP